MVPSGDTFVHRHLWRILCGQVESNGEPDQTGDSTYTEHDSSHSVSAVVPSGNTLTRHSLTLVAKKQRRLYIGKYSFSHRTITKWNKLSIGCINTSRVNIFKISQNGGLRIDKKWLDFQ